MSQIPEKVRAQIRSTFVAFGQNEGDVYDGLRLRTAIYLSDWVPFNLQPS